MQKALLVLVTLAVLLVSCGAKETVIEIGVCPLLAILPVVLALLIRR